MGCGSETIFSVPYGWVAMERISFETVLIGPNSLLREGVTRILSETGFHILASAYHVDDAVLKSLPQDQSVLLIIDVSDDFDVATRQIKSFKRQCPAGHVAVLGRQYRLPDMLSAFRAGANAYFVRVLTCDTFIRSLELVMLGETIVPAAILELVDDRQNGRTDDGSNETQLPNAGRDRHNQENANDADDDWDDDDLEKHTSNGGDNADALAAVRNCSPHYLSARQQSILDCLIHGDLNKAIARKIAIAEATVKVHVKAILRKIRVKNRTQAAIWAIHQGSPMLSYRDAISEVVRLPTNGLRPLDAQAPSRSVNSKSDFRRGARQESVMSSLPAPSDGPLQSLGGLAKAPVTSPSRHGRDWRVD